MLIGGEPGLGVLGWKADVESSRAGTVVHAGTILIKDKKSGPPATFELAPGGTLKLRYQFLRARQRRHRQCRERDFPLSEAVRVSGPFARFSAGHVLHLAYTRK